MLSKKAKYALKALEYLAANEIVVRNRSKETGCENCLRISIGTPEENENLVSALKKYST